ncbi:MAG: hypothetical protein JNK63_04170 [Chthonomonas sp.]|nr:hypothetical protein [Chthonomonas sp.]
MKVGAFTWRVELLTSESEFWAKLDNVGVEAERLGLEHVVLPESIVLELAALFPELSGPGLVARLSEVAPEFRSRSIALSQRHGFSLVAGSHFEERDGQVFNTSLFIRDGQVIEQSKNAMTQFEKVEWGVLAGSGLQVADEMATLICYDCEFPAGARRVCEEGALVLNVPAFTETRRGFQRVRWCAQARAVENQVFVIHASLAGGLGREPVPSTYGTSAILCPSVTPFPESAILAESKSGFAVADLDFEVLLACREQDDVRNWHDRQVFD